MMFRRHTRHTHEEELDQSKWIVSSVRASKFWLIIRDFGIEFGTKGSVKSPKDACAMRIYTVLHMLGTHEPIFTANQNPQIISPAFMMIMSAAKAVRKELENEQHRQLNHMIFLPKEKEKRRKSQLCGQGDGSHIVESEE